MRTIKATKIKTGIRLTIRDKGFRVTTDMTIESAANLGKYISEAAEKAKNAKDS